MTFSRTITLPLESPLEGELSSVMALDPGGTTGWAMCSPNEQEVMCGQIGPEEHHGSLWVLMSGANPETIVMESFQYRQFQGVAKAKVELAPVEYIGVVRLYKAIHAPWLNLNFHTASMGKKFVSDEKLRRLGWYKPTAGFPHARDALRHLVYYLVVTKHVKAPLTNKWLVRNE